MGLVFPSLITPPSPRFPHSPAFPPPFPPPVAPMEGHIPIRSTADLAGERSMSDEHGADCICNVEPTASGAPGWAPKAAPGWSSGSLDPSRGKLGGGAACSAARLSVLIAGRELCLRWDPCRIERGTLTALHKKVDQKYIRSQYINWNIVIHLHILQRPILNPNSVTTLESRFLAVGMLCALPPLMS
jgi:hypothetical protein